MNCKIQKISKGKKANQLWRKLFDLHKTEFKNQVCLKDKEYNNK